MNAGPVLLEAVELSVRFGGVAALSDVSFTVEEGEVVGLIGPNGAGKTTCIDALSGFQPLHGGHVRFAGEDLDLLAPHQRARKGFVRTFQSLDLFDDLVHFTRAFPHPRVAIEAPLVEVEELRCPGHGRRRWRRAYFASTAGGTRPIGERVARWGMRTRMTPLGAGKRALRGGSAPPDRNRCSRWIAPRGASARPRDSFARW